MGLLLFLFDVNNTVFNFSLKESENEQTKLGKKNQQQEIIVQNFYTLLRITIAWWSRGIALKYSHCNPEK